MYLLPFNGSLAVAVALLISWYLLAANTFLELYFSFWFVLIDGCLSLKTW